MQNGYTSATGQQYMPLEQGEPAGRRARHGHRVDAESFGVKWMRKVRTYGVADDGGDAEGGDAHRPSAGLKVIIADGECQLARQRRVRAEDADKLKARRARGAHALRGRRRDLHRRPFLHPPVRLPVAHRQAEPRSAAHRSGRERDRIAASAAACAARSRMRPCCARRSTAPRSSRTRAAGTASVHRATPCAVIAWLPIATKAAA